VRRCHGSALREEVLVGSKLKSHFEFLPSLCLHFFLSFFLSCFVSRDVHVTMCSTLKEVLFVQRSDSERSGVCYMLSLCSALSEVVRCLTGTYT